MQIKKAFENMSRFWVLDLENIEYYLGKNNEPEAKKLLKALKNSLMNNKQDFEAQEKTKSLSEKFLKCTNSAKKWAEKFVSEGSKFNEIEAYAVLWKELMAKDCLREHLDNED